MDFRRFIENIKHGWGHGWKNSRKRKAKHPDFIGYIRMPDEPENVPKGTLLELIGWTNRRNWKNPTMKMRIKVVEDEDSFIKAEDRAKEVWRELCRQYKYGDDYRNQAHEQNEAEIVKDDTEEVPE